MLRWRRIYQNLIIKMIYLLLNTRHKRKYFQMRQHIDTNDGNIVLVGEVDYEMSFKKMLSNMRIVKSGKSRT